METSLHWMRCTHNVWCSFTNVDLSQIHESGIYAIWHGGSNPRVVYVGQGNVSARLAEHRRDQSILKHASKGALFVTWASVPTHQRDGVEYYLASRYQPLEGSHYERVPIVVNSPWD